MKKEISREDERKLYEAYEVLDRICNGKSTVDIIVAERWAKIYTEVNHLFENAIANTYNCKEYYQYSEISYMARKSLSELFRKLKLK